MIDQFDNDQKIIKDNKLTPSNKKLIPKRQTAIAENSAY